jgi:hypothetical protein
MNAAASRALDCFSLRDPDGMKTAVLLCEDAPYLSIDSPTIPMLPDEITLPIKLITPTNE